VGINFGGGDDDKTNLTRPLYEAIMRCRRWRGNSDVIAVLFRPRTAIIWQIVRVIRVHFLANLLLVIALNRANGVTYNDKKLDMFCTFERFTDCGGSSY